MTTQTVVTKTNRPQIIQQVAAGEEPDQTCLEVSSRPPLFDTHSQNNHRPGRLVGGNQTTKQPRTQPMPSMQPPNINITVQELFDPANAVYADMGLTGQETDEMIAAMMRGEDDEDG
jgi:hypothetical protein